MIQLLRGEVNPLWQSAKDPSWFTRKKFSAILELHVSKCLRFDGHAPCRYRKVKKKNHPSSSVIFCYQTPFVSNTSLSPLSGGDGGLTPTGSDWTTWQRRRERNKTKCLQVKFTCRAPSSGSRRRGKYTIDTTVNQHARGSVVIENNKRAGGRRSCSGSSVGTAGELFLEGNHSNMATGQWHTHTFTSDSHGWLEPTTGGFWKTLDTWYATGDAQDDVQRISSIKIF